MEYLNRANRENHFLMLHLWYVVDRWTKDKGCQLTPGEKDDLDKAGKLIEGVGAHLFKRLDKEYGRKVIRDLETTVVRIDRATQLAESVACCSQKSADLLGDMVIGLCNNFRKEGCIKFKKCPVYQALADLGVPSSVLETNACPYRAEVYHKKTGTWDAPCFIAPPIANKQKQAICQKCGVVWNAETRDDEFSFCPVCGGELGAWE